MTRDTQRSIPIRCRPAPNGGTHPWLRWSARALLAVGLFLLGYVALVIVQARLYEAGSGQYVKRTSISPSGFRPPVLRLESVLSEGELLGHLRIPRLGVSAAVLQGTSSRTLRHGLGHIQRTALPGMPGNVAIAGHRDTFFRALKDVREGDEVELSTTDASILYIVDLVKVVDPEDNSVLGSDSRAGYALTLVTCYPFYFIGAAPNRYVVHAHKRTTMPPEIPPSGQSARTDVHVGGTQ